MDRDLARVDLWEESLRRSRERRERAAAQPAFELPARGLSVTAILALAGLPATAFAAGKLITGGADTPAKQVAIELPRGNAVGPAVGRAGAIDKPGKPAPASKNATSTGKRRAPHDEAGQSASAAAGRAGRTPAAAAQAGGQAPSVGEAQVSQGDESAPPDAAKATSAAPAAKAASVTPAAKATSAAPAAQVAPALASDGTATTRAKDTAHVASIATVAHTARRGGGVAELQRKLGVPADGVFGPQTERALKRWQRRHGLTADGVAGPQTRGALGLGAGKLLKRKRAARHRAHRRHHSANRAEHSGGGVRGLQQAIGVGADGVFGPATEQALERWQRAHGLTADGVAGPLTRHALGLGPGPVLKRKGSGGGGGGHSSAVDRVISAANRIATTPYRYGGGHGSFTDSGYDCSGSVSYALHGGGLLSSPLDSGALMSYGAPGPGRRITIYANPGHAYMTVDGRRFDTSARSETGSRWTNTRRSTGGYTIRHPRGL